MAIEHPKDQQLQEYLDGQLAAPRLSEIEQHVNTCPACAARVTAYRGLYDHLAEDDGYRLPEDFATKVAARAETAGEVDRSFSSWPLVAAVAAVVAVAVWFFDLSVLLPSLDGLAALQKAQFTGLLNSCSQFLSNFGLRTDYLFFGILTLLVIGGVDRILRMAQRGHALFTV